MDVVYISHIILYVYLACIKFYGEQEFCGVAGGCVLSLDSRLAHQTYSVSQKNTQNFLQGNAVVWNLLIMLHAVYGGGGLFHLVKFKVLL